MGPELRAYSFACPIRFRRKLALAESVCVPSVLGRGDRCIGSPKEKHKGGNPMSRSLAFMFVASSIVSAVSIAYAQHAMMDDKELMAKLKGAAPASIIERATILNMGADGKMKVIQQGNNGWT